MRQIVTVEHSPLSNQAEVRSESFLKHFARNPLRASLARWLNRGLAEDRTIELRIAWPVWLIPILLLNQLFAPHMVWVVFLVALSGFYLVGYLWVRNQAPAISLNRQRVGSLLVAGDLLQEEFELRNRSALPVLWAEFVDHSNVPGYNAGRIVACEGEGVYRWRTEVLTKQRGLFRLGPDTLRTQDPLGLFSITIVNPNEEIVLIYPRVVHLPPVHLPRGDTQGSDRQRRPIFGHLPAATVSDYQRGDSLRHVHWMSTARRGRLMVKDLELEPSGNVWLVLDLDRHVQEGDGQTGTLEHGIVVAASLAAELLGGRDQRAVGLRAFGGESTEVQPGGLVEVLPGAGSAHTWRILTALAPVTAGDLGVAALLASSRDRIGRRSTVIVVTPVAGGEAIVGSQTAKGAENDWVAELILLKSMGVDCSVVLVAPAGADTDAGDGIMALLARMDIPCTRMAADAPLPALLTFRRRRRIVRTTPTGGAVSYEVDEEVG
jgi:uncharacterized protein (DUF58 family)